MVTHQTVWLSIGEAKTIFEFYVFLEMLTDMTDFCRQVRTSGIKSLAVELLEIKIRNEIL